MAIGTAAAIGLGLGAVGNIYGATQAGARQRDAMRALEEARKMFGDLSLPELAEYSPELAQYIGGYDPVTEQLIQAGPTAYEQIQMDPRLRAEQMAALEQISALSEGGLSEADLAGLELSRRRAGATAQAQQQGILQNLQQRGMGGSGAELIARLQAAQSGADRELDSNLEIAQMAQQRALQALGQRGTMAGSVREQDFGEQQRLAAARDAIAQFNAQLASGREARGADRGTQARIYDVQTRQDLEAQRAREMSRVQLAERERQQQMFNNEMARTKGMAGQQADIANALNQQAATEAQLWSGLGKTAIEAGVGLAKK